MTSQRGVWIPYKPEHGAHYPEDRFAQRLSPRQLLLPLLIGQTRHVTTTNCKVKLKLAKMSAKNKRPPWDYGVCRDELQVYNKLKACPANIRHFICMYMYEYMYMYQMSLTSLRHRFWVSRKRPSLCLVVILPMTFSAAFFLPFSNSQRGDSGANLQYVNGALVCIYQYLWRHIIRSNTKMSNVVVNWLYFSFIPPSNRSKPQKSTSL